MLLGSFCVYSFSLCIFKVAVSQVIFFDLFSFPFIKYLRKIVSIPMTSLTTIMLIFLRSVFPSHMYTLNYRSYIPFPWKYFHLTYNFRLDQMHVILSMHLPHQTWLSSSILCLSGDFVTHPVMKIRNWKLISAYVIDAKFFWYFLLMWYYVPIPNFHSENY